MGQGSSYDQLHRNIVIRADIYGGANSKPRILAAGLGFEGITRIPGLLGENQIALAEAAGAGVVKELLGLNPAADGQNIRVAIPPLTEERRKEFVKLTRKFGEDSKVSLRNLRRDMIHEIEKLEKEKAIGEDDKNRGKKEADDLLHKFEKQLSDLIALKEKEIMEV
jgi:hypothetical protein